MFPYQVPRFARGKIEGDVLHMSPDGTRAAELLMPKLSAIETAMALGYRGPRPLVVRVINIPKNERGRQ